MEFSYARNGMGYLIMRARFINEGIEDILKPRSKNEIENALESKSLKALLDSNPHYSIRAFSNRAIIKKINDLSIKQKIKYLDDIRQYFISYGGVQSNFYKSFIDELIDFVDFDDNNINLILDSIDRMKKEEKNKLLKKVFDRVNSLPSDQRIDFYFNRANSRRMTPGLTTQLSKLFKEEDLLKLIRGFIRYIKIHSSNPLIRKKLNEIDEKELENTFKRLSSKELEFILYRSNEQDNLSILVKRALSNKEYKEKNHNEALIRGIEKGLINLVQNAVKYGADVIWILDDVDLTYFDTSDLRASEMNQKYIEFVNKLLDNKEDIFVKIVSVEGQNLNVTNILTNKTKKWSLSDFENEFVPLRKKQFQKEINEIEEVINDMKKSYMMGKNTIKRLRTNILSYINY